MACPRSIGGNLFFCDWGLQTVFRFEIRKAGGTHAVSRRTAFVTKGGVDDFRPFSMAVAADGASLWLVDWAYTGWLADRVRTGRLYRLRYSGPNPVAPSPRPPWTDLAAGVRALDHPALSVRRESQQKLARMGAGALPSLVERLQRPEPETGRLHALWALDAIGGDQARHAIGVALGDSSPRVRLQAARSAGIRGDRAVASDLARMLGDRDAAVRREAAIALGKLGDPAIAPALYAALGDADAFAAWSVRQAIRRLEAWDQTALVEALLDERRLEPALRLTDEAWALPVAAALTEALSRTQGAAVRARIVANLAGMYRQYPAWSGAWFGTNPLAGPAPQKTRDWSPEGMKLVLEGLSRGLADRDRSVRMQAIAGVSQAGKVAAPRLRGARTRDRPRQPVVADRSAGRPRRRRVADCLCLAARGCRSARDRPPGGVGALTRSRDPRSLRARLSVIYDDKAPPALVAAALPDLARLGFLPPNELSSFMRNPAPEIRTAALLSLNVKKALPADVEQSVLDALDDKNDDVRRAAIWAVVPLRLSAAMPRLKEMAANAGSPDRTPALIALCASPDPRAVSAYLSAIQDPDPRVRKAGESALVAIRDRAAGEIEKALSSRTFSGPAALSLARVLAHFQPLLDWRVIGPFPRATPQLFLGAPAIDFNHCLQGCARSLAGLEVSPGRASHWATRAE